MLDVAKAHVDGPEPQTDRERKCGCDDHERRNRDEPPCRHHAVEHHDDEKHEKSNQEINDRREEGDLRENGGYHAAREQQGQEEARIRQLQELLNNAKVGEAPKQSGVALPGSVVKVQYGDDKSDTETFLIATRQEGISDGKLEVYSPNSPLGGALLDAKVGETRTYTVPNGNTVKVTLVSAEPYHA